MRKMSRRGLLAAGLVGIPVVLYLAFGSHGLVRRIELGNRISSLEEQIDTVKADIRRLEEEAKALESDPKTIEKVAREKYGMAKEGETVYRIRKPEDNK